MLRLKINLTLGFSFVSCFLQIDYILIKISLHFRLIEIKKVGIFAKIFILSMNYILVTIGAGIGGGLRYFLSDYTARLLPIYFPFGTLLVNALGSLILGFLIFGFDDKELLASNMKLLLGVGFCGGLTTFSTFSLETINLLRDSQFLFAGLNILLNLFITLAGIYLAYIITK